MYYRSNAKHKNCDTLENIREIHLKSIVHKKWIYCYLSEFKIHSMKRPCSENKNSLQIRREYLQNQRSSRRLVSEDTTAYLLERIKLQKQNQKNHNRISRILARMQSNRNSYCVLLLRMQNSRPASESSLATSYKVKYVFVINRTVLLLENLLKWIENHTYTETVFFTNFPQRKQQK